MQRRSGVPGAVILCLVVLLGAAGLWGRAALTADAGGSAPSISADVAGRPDDDALQRGAGRMAGAGAAPGDIVDAAAAGALDRGSGGAAVVQGRNEPFQESTGEMSTEPSEPSERSEMSERPAGSAMNAAAAGDRPIPMRLAIEAVAEQLLALWADVTADAVAVDQEARESAVLAEIPLWDDAARLRATYELVDLDRLQERVAARRGEHTTYVGVSGELQLRDAVALKIGYTLRPAAEGNTGRLVGAADAAMEYRLGDRMTVGADVVWGFGASSEHAAGVNVSYALAPGASLRADYRLLSFDASDRASAQHSAEAGVQLRF